MSFGISVHNERGRVLVSSEEVPYRFLFAGPSSGLPANYMDLLSDAALISKVIAGGVQRVYVADRIRPAANAAGFGLNVVDASGRPLMNSSTPLAQVVDIITGQSVTYNNRLAVFDAGPSAGRICIVENSQGSYYRYQYSYPGGGWVTVDGGNEIELKEEAGRFKVYLNSWEGESGEGSQARPWITQVRCTILNRPARDIPWQY